VCNKFVCAVISSRGSSGSHNRRKDNIDASLAALNSLETSSPSSDGCTLRESPSKTTLRVPGIWVASATLASRCMERVVNTIFPLRANIEFTLFACAHASELLLSP